MIEKIRPITKSMRGERRYLCRCECGNELIVTEDNLIHGRVTTCGFCINQKKEEEPANLNAPKEEPKEEPKESIEIMDSLEYDKVEEVPKKGKKGKKNG